MKTLKTLTVEFSKDVYKMEVVQGTYCLFYSIYINGKFEKTYKRLPKELREFFNY